MELSGNQKSQKLLQQSPFAYIFEEHQLDTDFYKERVRQALKLLPPVKCVFAYGSGAVPQIGWFLFLVVLLG